MKTLATLRVKIYADGADKAGMLEANSNPLIKGMTTNPTLLRNAGVKNFEAFAREILETVTEKPISFEVFADEFPEMRRQAVKISSWGKNVYVKIPITNSRAESALPLIHDLSAEGMKLNITAIATLEQVEGVAATLHPETPSVVSVIAGRIADSGVDPIPQMRESKNKLKALPRSELLWASVREVLNIYQADACHCDIVTVPHELLRKAEKFAGMELKNLSLDTVKMFVADIREAGFTL
jgi:transaldolase